MAEYSAPSGAPCSHVYPAQCALPLSLRNPMPPVFPAKWQPLSTHTHTLGLFRRSCFCCTYIDIPSCEPCPALIAPGRLLRSDGVIEALDAKVAAMESTHASREKDWHILANKWIKYEEALHEHYKK